MAYTDLVKSLDEATRIQKGSIAKSGERAEERAVAGTRRGVARSGLGGALGAEAETRAREGVQEITAGELNKAELNRLKELMGIKMKQEELELMGDIADQQLLGSIFGGIGNIVGTLGGAWIKANAPAPAKT